MASGWLVVLPVILGMLIYASTLSYAANPLMPALQNSPLLTVHVFTAALAYGAAVIAFGAGVMYLLAPRIAWHARALLFEGPDRYPRFHDDLYRA